MGVRGMRLLKKNIQIFCGSAVTVLELGTVLVLFTLNNAQIMTRYVDTIRCVTKMLAPQVAVFVAFLFMSYEFFFKVNDTGAGEFLQSLPGGRARQLLSGLAVMALAVGLVFLDFLGFGLAAMGREGILHSGVMARHVAAVFFLDIFLVGFFACVLGCLVAQFQRRITGYSLLFGCCMLFTPFLQQILSSLSNEKLPIINLGDLFELKYPLTLEMFEPVYGFANEPERWGRMVFWLLLALAALLVYMLWRHLLRLRWLPAAAVCAVLAGWGLLTYAQGGCVMYMGENNLRGRDEDTTFSGSSYYEYNKGFIKDEPESFAVTDYQMRLRLDNQLEAEVTMALAGTEGRSEECYRFTLYRGFTVTEVRDETGRALPFYRESDYLDIETEQPLSAVTICYRGYSGKFYSNRQAVKLPAFFPYYPMAGYRPLVLRESGMEYINTCPEGERFFDITIQGGPEALYCNLPGEDGHFYGVAEGPSLLGGLVEKKEIDGIQVVYPISQRFLYTETYGYENTRVDAQLPMGQVRAQYDRLCEQVGQTPQRLAEKTVFCWYSSSSMTVGDETVASFADHVLLEIWSLSPEKMAAYLLAGELQDKMTDDYPLLRSTFTVSYLSDKSIFNRSARSALKDIRQNPDTISGREETVYLYQAAERWGDQAVSRAVYEFLRDRSDQRPAAEFLKQLVEEGPA